MKFSNITMPILNPDLVITKLQTIYYSTTTDWYRPHPLPRYTNGLILFTEGSIRYNFEDCSITAKPGDILKFPKGLIYSGKRICEQNSFFVIDFETASENELARFPLPTIYQVSSYPNVYKRFQHILTLWNENSTTSHLQCRMHIYNLLSYLIDNYTLYDDSSLNVQRVKYAIEYMKQELGNANLSILDICHHVSLSESQLRRIFHQITGKSPMHYLHEMRINHAKELLLYDNLSIKKISEICGYASLYYFSRDFKNATGYPPTHYRFKM